MRGTIIFVVASFILPALAGPVPIQDTVALSVNSNIEQRASETTDHTTSRDLSERTPIIEAIPVVERGIARPKGGWTRSAGIVRPNGGWSRSAGIARPNGGWSRSADDHVERGIARPKGGW